MPNDLSSASVVPTRELIEMSIELQLIPKAWQMARKTTLDFVGSWIDMYKEAHLIESNFTQKNQIIPRRNVLLKKKNNEADQIQRFVIFSCLKAL